MTTSPNPESGSSLTDDPYLWLEEVDSEDSLTWVRARNALVQDGLASTAAFAAKQEAILGVLDSDDKIPDVAKAGEWYYNLWRDVDHERGLWRRTTPESYRTDEPDWDVLLDLDALNRTEMENWVWHGASILRTGPLAFGRALVTLSRGGSDADVTREFDLESRTFLADGFVRPEAKGDVGWIDEDSVFVATDTGPGSLTSSGYPRQARRWLRGQRMQDAALVFEGTDEDMLVAAVHDRTPGYERDVVFRQLTFYTNELYLLGPGDDLMRIEVPDSAEASIEREWLTVELREDWTVGGRTYLAGSLLASVLEAFLAGGRALDVLYEPTPTSALAGYTWTRHRLVLNVLEDVRSRLEILTPPAESGGAWDREPFAGAPALGTVQVAAVDADESDQVWVYATDYLTPTTLSIAELGSAGPNAAPEPLKSMPVFFDGTGSVVDQHFATSADGTQVPYFVVRPRDLAFDATAPTLLYGYGGFEISLTPTYSGGVGRAWIEPGGVYVVANIRGGGEYGPAWHQAALRENRQRAYEDFAAVARDLVDSQITAPAHLGVMGGSNGGLLTGNMLTQYPELFGAVVIQVPLLDMRRYHRLLAGASWMAEYGDPDTDDWSFIATFSPYHLFDPSRAYPPVLFTTSTRDDRVHPGHARKLAAAMLAAGEDVTYYENIEGGHGGAATNAQAAFMTALALSFLAERLGAAE